MTPQAWLDSEQRDYEAGRQLYEQLGDNPRLKRVLAGGPSYYTRESLAWELTKLARAGVTAEVASAEAPREDGQDGQDGQHPDTVSDPGTAPETAALLDELKLERRPLYDERTVLHQGLENAATDADRLEDAQRIMQLSHGIDASYATSAHVQEHGERPAGPAPAPGLDTLTPAELLKKRNNLRSQRTKLGKRPDRAADLATVEATLAQVEALLNVPA